MCSRRVCGSTPGDWDANNPVLAVSLRRCRTTAYTSSAIPCFTNMLLSPRPFGSRSVVRLGVIDPELRPPQVAIPSVRDTAHTFASYGSRERDIMGNVHFASSTEHSPWTALRVRWVPLYRFPPLSLRAFAMCAALPGRRSGVAAALTGSPTAVAHRRLSQNVACGCRDRNAAHATVGGEFPICTLSVVQRVPRSTMVHDSASPPAIPDGRLSRVRFWPRLCTPFSRDSPSRPL